MMKFTNSFCRLLKDTYENISNRTHLRFFTSSSTRRVMCIMNRINKKQEWSVNNQHLRFYAKGKKKIQGVFTLPFQFYDPKINKLMNESSKSSIQNVGSEENHYIVTEKGNSAQGNQKQFKESNSKHSSESWSRRQNFRVWEPIEKKSATGVLRFRVVSYNVLSQYLLECHPYLYTSCSPHNLKWKIRSQRLYNEIRNLQPDILCLQEVQTSHLNSFYSKFKKIGYYEIFKQKTGHRFDGCAIYFKESLFDLKDRVSVEFYQPKMPILNRDNIGIIVKLTPKSNPSTPIIVATTHLLYNPARTDVRLAQMKVFLAEIDRFAYYNNGAECGHHPIILTGDFNSKPQSAVIKLLDERRVSVQPSRDQSDWRKLGVTDNCQHLSVYINSQKGQSTDFNITKIYNSEYGNTRCTAEAETCDDDYNCMFNSGVIGHSLELKSVYDKLKPDGQQEATTFQNDWCTVDYIYFSKCRILKLVERLRLPTVFECDALGSLPNDVYASDHLALAADFELSLDKPSKC